MVYRGLVVLNIALLLIVNLRYYWELPLGHLAFPIYLGLVFLYLFLLATLLFQSVLGVQQKKKSDNTTSAYNLIRQKLQFVPQIIGINYEIQFEKNVC